MPTSLQERLARKSFPTSCGCIIWLGSTDPKGYGRLYNPNGSRHVHRIAYEIAKGPVPKGKELDHLCRVPACVNPDHLEPVTRKENALRGMAGTINSARYAARTHCKRGHELSPENTYVFKPSDGFTRRKCKRCSAIELREWRMSRQ